MKNNVKIIYDPKPMKQEKIWVKTSIQCYRTSKTTIGEVILLIAIFVGIALVWRILA